MDLADFSFIFIKNLFMNLFKIMIRNVILKINRFKKNFSVVSKLINNVIISLT